MLSQINSNYNNFSNIHSKTAFRPLNFKLLTSAGSHLRSIVLSRLCMGTCFIQVQESVGNLEERAVYISKTISACQVVCSDCSCFTISEHTKQTKETVFGFN
jgi:hypothetical protein